MLTSLTTGIGQVGSPDSDTWGNGAAAARLLVHNGVKILGCDLHLSSAERTKQRLLNERPEASVNVFACDVTKPDEVKAFVAAAVDKHGRLDILVNNVGLTAAGSPETMSHETWSRQIDINLTSVYHLCHLVLPIMEQQRSGSIINNASITAMRYIGKHQIAYASAKAGVVQFSKAMGVMYAKSNIRSVQIHFNKGERSRALTRNAHCRCNCVVPGLMYTPLVENFAQSKDPGDQEAARRIKDHNVPMGWMGTGEDVANAVAWLASGASRYVTAHALVVDGGITQSTGTGFQAQE